MARGTDLKVGDRVRVVHYSGEAVGPAGQLGVITAQVEDAPEYLWVQTDVPMPLFHGAGDNPGWALLADEVELVDNVSV